MTSITAEQHLAVSDATFAHGILSNPHVGAAEAHSALSEAVAPPTWQQWQQTNLTSATDDALRPSQPHDAQSSADPVEHMQWTEDAGNFAGSISCAQEATEALPVIKSDSVASTLRDLNVPGASFAVPPDFTRHGFRMAKLCEVTYFGCTYSCLARSHVNLFTRLMLTKCPSFRTLSQRLSARKIAQDSAASKRSCASRHRPRRTRHVVDPQRWKW